MKEFKFNAENTNISVFTRTWLSNREYDHFLRLQTKILRVSKDGIDESTDLLNIIAQSPELVDELQNVLKKIMSTFIQNKDKIGEIEDLPAPLTEKIKAYILKLIPEVQADFQTDNSDIEKKKN